MKIFLAGTRSDKRLIGKGLERIPYVLESFYYIKEWQLPLIDGVWKEFLLDSGAYTFMNSKIAKGNNSDYFAYLEKYIDFINTHNIQHFFELDLDYVIGYDKTLELRKRLEAGTGKQCIPVFHKSRGLDEWKKMCEQYSYVAIGSIHEYDKHQQILLSLVNIAKRSDTKLHGLGYTRANAKQMGFYSIDSTTWLSGGRFGRLYYIKNGKLRQISKPNKNMKIKEEVPKNEVNLSAWIEWQYINERWR